MAWASARGRSYIPLSPPSGTVDSLGSMPGGSAVEGLHLPIFNDSEGQGESLGRTAASQEGGGTEEVTGGREKENGGMTKAAEAPAKGGDAKKAAEVPAKPFLLSEGLPPVPAKLVSGIQNGDFVDMSELLRDNLEAQRRGALQEPGGSSPASASRSRREVPDLLSWVQCFGVYTAVVADKYPERVKKLLAYQTLIVREARRCGGKGWLSYDSYFRQQMAGDWKGEEWGRLNPYFISSTFVALGSASWPSCTLCLESDHRDEDCALAKEKSSTPGTRPAANLTEMAAPGSEKERLPVPPHVSRGTRESAFTHTAGSAMPALGAEESTASSTVV